MDVFTYGVIPDMNVYNVPLLRLAVNVYNVPL